MSQTLHLYRWCRGVVRFGRTLIVLSVVVGWPAGGSAADPPVWCDQRLLKAASISHPYAMRGVYCDGNVTREDAGQIEIVAYTLGLVAYGNDPRGPLILGLPVGVFVRPDLTPPIYVRGVQKAPGKNYRLDGAFVKDEPLAIDRVPTLTPIKVSENDLGLIAWTEQSSGAIYIPVIAGPASRATPIGQLELVLRPPTAAPLVTYSIVEVATRRRVAGADAKVNAPALEPITVPIPTGGEALLEVTVKLVIPGDSGYSRSIIVWRPATQ